MKSPAFEAEATIEARAADLSDGGFGSYNDEIPPGRFKPVEYVAASGSGPAPVLDDPNARPCAVYVGSKPVEFPTYCKPFRPDSATGVVCPILTVLDELIKQGVHVSYKMIFGRESPQEKAKQLITKEAIYEEAKKRSEELVGQTQNRINQLRKAANEYMDESLRQTEEVMAAALDEVRETRMKFRSVTEAQEQRKNVNVDIEV